MPLRFDLGTDKHSFGFGGTGKKSHAKKFSDYGEPYGLHDVIGCLLDCEVRAMCAENRERNYMQEIYLLRTIGFRAS